MSTYKNAGAALAHKVWADTHPEMVETIRDDIRRGVPRLMILLHFTFESDFMQQAISNEIDYLMAEKASN